MYENTTHLPCIRGVKTRQCNVDQRASCERTRETRQISGLRPLSSQTTYAATMTYRRALVAFSFIPYLINWFHQYYSRHLNDSAHGVTLNRTRVDAWVWHRSISMTWRTTGDKRERLRRVCRIQVQQTCALHTPTSGMRTSLSLYGEIICYLPYTTQFVRLYLNLSIGNTSKITTFAIH